MWTEWTWREVSGVDKYSEIMVEIEHSDNPRQAIETLQRLVCGVCEDGPAREGILWAAAFLAALSDYKNPRQLVLLTDFTEVAEALDLVIADAQQNMEASWALWRAEVDHNATEMEEN